MNRALKAAMLIASLTAFLHSSIRHVIEDYLHGLVPFKVYAVITNVTSPLDILLLPKESQYAILDYQVLCLNSDTYFRGFFFVVVLVCLFERVVNSFAM